MNVRGGIRRKHNKKVGIEVKNEIVRLILVHVK